jgi:hypothetical protein
MVCKPGLCPPDSGNRSAAAGSRAIGVSLQPAIPRRVAPQQSPSLHRSPALARHRRCDAIPPSCASEVSVFLSKVVDVVSVTSLGEAIWGVNSGCRLTRTRRATCAGRSDARRCPPIAERPLQPLTDAAEPIAVCCTLLPGQLTRHAEHQRGRNRNFVRSLHLLGLERRRQGRPRSRSRPDAMRPAMLRHTRPLARRDPGGLRSGRPSRTPNAIPRRRPSAHGNFLRATKGPGRRVTARPSDVGDERFQLQSAE